MARKNSSVAIVDPPPAPVKARRAPRAKARESSPPAQPFAPYAETRKGRGLAERFGIGEANLARRREFVRLGEEDRRVLLCLASWAVSIAPKVAAEFYDWQFTFGPTLSFFQNFADQRKMSLGALRQHLESAQTAYIATVFSGAAESWGVAYFEERLNVGRVHDIINLPFKWYIGSYVELEFLLRRHLRRDFKDSRLVAAAELALSMVFNYDMQAVGDSFLVNTLESMGLDMNAIEATGGGDKTESLTQVKDAIRVLGERAGRLGRAAHGREPADGRQRRGDRRAGQGGLHRQRRRFEACLHRRRQLRGDAGLHPRNLQGRQ